MESIVLLLLFIGIIFFGVCVLIMVALFGWSMKDAGKNSGGLLVLAGVAIALPLVTYMSTQSIQMSSKANASVKITDTEVVRVDKDYVMINVTLDNPGVVYLKYQDATSDFEIPVLPTSTYSKKTSHSFLVQVKTPEGGEATIVVNGEDYLTDGLLKVKP